MPLNLIFIQPGTYTIDDNGIPGDNISVIRDSNGVVIFTFGHPPDALGFTVSTPGVNLIINFTDSMNAANFTIGNLTNAAESPDSIVMQNIQTTGTVTLAATGSITEGSDSDDAADILAGALIMSAGTGIGVPGNAIETQTGLFEAETATGGIAITNFGSVQIGGVSADVDGLDVATSGDIAFTAIGSIFLSEPNSFTAGEVVHGGSTSGNVTLVADGFSSDVIGNVDNGAITAPRGSLTVTAGRDIQLGTVGADFNNDVVTNGSLTLNAGRDIVIDGFADILADNFGLDTGGNLVFNAGEDISILEVAGVSASVTASGSGGGDALLTTGPGGVLTVNGPGSFALGSTSGDVIVTADRILIDDGSGISAPAGTVTLRTATEGRAIVLGSASDAAAALELSNVELNRVFTPTLTIGSDEGGQVRVIAPISLTTAGNAPDLFIRSATSILLETNITVLDQLSLISLDDVFQTGASTLTGNSIIVSVDAVDDDPGTGAFATLNGSLIGTNTVNGNADVDTLRGTNEANSLFGFGSNDILRGFGGNDFLNGGTGNDNMAGGLGNDTYRIDSTLDVITELVGEGDDTLSAESSYTLAAGVSIETLTTINAAATTPIGLTGNEFNNSIFGNAGNNVLNGGGGTDSLNGLGGNDTLDGGAGADNMNGGAGNDIYRVDNAADAVVEAAGGGDDTVFASVNYTLAAGVDVQALRALNAADTTALNLTGNELNNSLSGNAGVNVLAGGFGNDLLEGLGGDDTLRGGAGNDVLRGGSGLDNFLFNTALNAATNVDQILDFVVADDTILIDNAVFIGLNGGVLDPAAFRTGAAAADADDRIIYNSATGALFFDADGNGAGAQVQFATLTTGLALTNADFLVV